MFAMRAAPPTAADVLRTTWVVASEIAPILARMARGDRTSSSAGDGLAQIAGRFARVLARLGVEVEVRHRERVPAEGGVTFMWNQESHLDHLVLPVAIPRPFFTTYNNEVARLPFYGAQLRRGGHVHLDRNDEAQWRPAIARAAERVRGGECVLVSPEGTRSRDGRLLPMKRGALLLARTSGRPVSCVTVVGGHLRLPRGSAFVRKGRLVVDFAQPIDGGLPDAELAAAVAATFERLKAENAPRVGGE
jgi:1-acyl-sn-glycerol-3-phosphate acyltransferase